MNEQKPQNSPINRHGGVPTPIGDLTLPVRSWSPGIEAPEEQLTYVDLSSISSEAKAIESPSELLGSEAPSRARQKIRGRDILVSTVRPNLNAVAWVTSEFDGATASTGFCVLRPNLEIVCDRYLYHWVRTPEFFGEMTKVATGASYPAVSDRIIKNSKIPLPPSLAEQKRLAAILDQADAIRRKRQQALRLTDDFLRSVFLDFFGDPVTNPKGWPEIRFGDVIQEGPQNGLYKPSTEYGSGTPILRIDAFYDGVVLAESSLKRLRLSPEDKSLYLLREGDIVVNRVNSLEYLGKSAIIPRFSEEIVFESNIMRMSMDRLRFEPRFIVAMLQTQHIKRQIKICAKQAVNQASINQSDVKSLRIFEPPMALQRDYVRTVEQLEKLQRQQVRHLAEAETLFQSLQHRAFTGQL